MPATVTARGDEEESRRRLRLVVLGCGFGGYSVLARLPGRRFEATLISRRNYFLFTPLLPSAVSGTVEFRSILEPARRRLRDVRMIEAAAFAIDLDQHRVRCRSEVTGEHFDVEWDILIIAVGARIADFGIPGVDAHTLQLSSVEDARTLRRELLSCFAAAEVPGLSEEEVRRRLRFAVCGGGPTGVEVAAEIQDLLRGELNDLHPELAPLGSVVLLEARERILGGFDRALSEYAGQHFQREGIELRTGAPVVQVDARRIHLRDGSEVAYGLAIWAGGNAATDLIQTLDLDKLQGRLVVDDYLRLPGRANVYAIGDCAAAGDPPLPATAALAQQQGKYLAHALRRRIAGREPKPFRFKRFGMLAYVGGGRALADLPYAKWKGRTAWVFWRSVYLTKLVSLSNKMKVLLDWIKARLFGRDLSRF
jgi:NADH:ubiquinone reductase (non-electrogenic)